MASRDGKHRVSEQDQKRREDAAGDQAIDKAVGEIERADRHQRNDGDGDQQNTRHGSGLSLGQQQKGEEDQKGDDEKQNERRLHENLRDEHAEDAAGRHENREADGLLEIERPASGQKLNGEQRRQEGKVPAKHDAQA